MNTPIETIDAIERALDAKVAEIKASIATVRLLVCSYAKDGEPIVVPISRAPMPDTPAGRTQSKATTGAAVGTATAPVRVAKKGRPRGALTVAVEEAIASFQEFSSKDIEKWIADEDPDLDVSDSAISKALYGLEKRGRITVVSVDSVDGRTKRYRRNESFRTKEAA